MAATDLIFTPFDIGNLTLRNRVVAPPMVQCRPITSPEGIAWYRRLAAGGAGLVIVEATGMTGFGSELTVETLSPLVKAAHDEGAAIAIQLFPIPFGSAVDLNSMPVDQIEAIIEQYAVAAEICRDAGFDGVEPHGAHGYLLNQFFMPDVNKRTDDFGGSLENRCRFAARIVERIKAATGDDLLIFYRHTPVGAAYGVEESLELARRLVEAGAGVLDISPAFGDEPADLAAPFKAAFDVPVIAVGSMNDTEMAVEALSASRCDLIAVGRQLIADAQWPNKLSDGREDDVTFCVDCNGCFDDIAAPTPVTCRAWDGDPVAEYLS